MNSLKSNLVQLTEQVQSEFVMLRKGRKNGKGKNNGTQERIL